ncbi:TIR domain-containing protein [Paenibacillus sp. MCAF9]|uniref:TIR domain-containing protein n=1 Tax=Paenibacillus sp. MCAF9 TaxID=3233046 RepID=UPI003F9B74FD
MKLFLSWSGTESKQLAVIFKEWLPNVLQYTQPYMSAKDIFLGEMWNNNIRNNLEESVFGLIFVTPNNINSPWINYEAGALAKTLDSKVVPILYNADVMILNEGPLKQFQSAKSLGKEDVYSLLKSINSTNEQGKLDESRLEKAFEVWWPELNGQINNITTDDSISPVAEPSEKDLLNVIYSKVVEQEKLLKRETTNKEMRPFVPSKLILDLRKVHKVLVESQTQLDGGPFTSEFLGEQEDGRMRLERVIDFLESRLDEQNLSRKRNKEFNVV